MWNGMGRYVVRGNNRTVTNFQSELRPRRQSSALFFARLFSLIRLCGAEEDSFSVFRDLISDSIWVVLPRFPPADPGPSGSNGPGDVPAKFYKIGAHRRLIQLEYSARITPLSIAKVWSSIDGGGRKRNGYRSASKNTRVRRFFPDTIVMIQNLERAEFLDRRSLDPILIRGSIFQVSRAARSRPLSPKVCERDRYWCFHARIRGHKPLVMTLTQKMR